METWNTSRYFNYSTGTTFNFDKFCAFSTILFMVNTLDHTIKLVSKLEILGIILTILHDWTSKVHIVGWHILIDLKIMCNVLSFI